MTSHHAPEDWLVAYAAGTLPEAEALVLACHLTLCPACRDRVAALEAVGGAYLDAVTADGDDEALLAATLDALDGSVPTPEAPAVDPDGVLPAPLAARVGRFADLPWRWFLPGVEQVVVDDVATAGMPLRLFRLAPDQAVAPHTHEGLETQVVLTGGFTDDGGHFVRGDLCQRSEGTHRQHIDPGEPCVVLVAADQPLVPRSFRGFLARLVRRV